MRRRALMLHFVLGLLGVLTLLPYVFLVNNSFRLNTELYRSFFGLPRSVEDLGRVTWYKIKGQEDRIVLNVAKEQKEGAAEEPTKFVKKRMSYNAACSQLFGDITRGYRHAWKQLRPYTINTILVCAVTVLGVLLLGSISGYVFSRYRFPGRNVLFVVILSIIMIPPVLTLVPSFLVVKQMGLLNSYWVLVLPYIAGGQIFAIFLFKGFFDGLPEELFESARLDGAGYLAIYRHIVLPLSGQVIAVVSVMTILGTWNNFLWPLVTNTDAHYHVITSGLYLMAQGQTSQNFSAMMAGYVLASIPLLILFVYATKPFMQGVTSGAFKA